MSLLYPGSNYVLDGVHHCIPSTERVIGPPVKWNAKKQEFFTKLKQLLAHFHETCTAAGIPYYISCGTLLGAVKMKGFLPSDTDADVCVLQEDIPRLKEAFANTPFILTPFRYGLKLAVHEFPHYPFLDIMPVALLPSHLNPNSEPTYSFSYPLDRNQQPTFELRLFFNKKKHPARLIFPLRKYEFEGMELWGPAKGTEVCYLNYGENCLRQSFTKICRKHCISGFTAVWGYRLWEMIGGKK